MPTYLTYLRPWAHPITREPGIAARTDGGEAVLIVAGGAVRSLDEASGDWEMARYAPNSEQLAQARLLLTASAVREHFEPASRGGLRAAQSGSAEERSERGRRRAAARWGRREELVDRAESVILERMAAGDDAWAAASAAEAATGLRVYAEGPAGSCGEGAAYVASRGSAARRSLFEIFAPPRAGQKRGFGPHLRRVYAGRPLPGA